MKSIRRTLPFLAAALILAACEGDDGINGEDGLDSLVATREIPKGDADCAGGGLALDSGLDQNRNGILDAAEVTASEFLECATAPQLRALHASTDAPLVNILVDGVAVASNVDFTQGTGFLPVGEKPVVQVEAILPGSTFNAIDAQLDLEFSTDYTVIALGTVGGATAPIRPLTIANPTDERLTPGNFFAQVVHAAAAAPPVDVYVTSFGAVLANEAPINDVPLAYEGSTERLEVLAGDYQIRVTLAGQPNAVVYDSGEIPLPAGADLLIAAVDNVGPGDAAVKLVVLDGAGAATLLADATPAAVVAVHASPDAGTVDLLADIEATANDEALPLARNVDFTDVCRISSVPAPDTYTINVAESGNNASIPLSIPGVAVEPGVQYTAVVTGFALGGIPALQALPPLVTDGRSIATQATLRIIHASPSTSDVDVYLLPDGTNLNDPMVMPSLTLAFGADSGVVPVAPDTYDVYVTPQGDKSIVAIEIPNLPLNGGEVWDVFARDPLPVEGPLPQAQVINYSALADCTI
jgi:hypothetical protein